MATTTVSCFQCGRDFQQDVKYQNENIKLRQNNYCSRKCLGLTKRTNRIDIPCGQCNAPLQIPERLYTKSKTKRFFCNSSCSGSYNNAHKEYGIRRSKLEKFVETKLPVDFPTLKFEFNKKDTIGSELDVFCPDLNLGIEINGICHYKPIYGDEVFNKIKQNDAKKAKVCEEKGIQLFVLDTSKHSYVNEKTCDKYYQNIVAHIKEWSGRQELNLRPFAPKANALARLS